MNGTKIAFWVGITCTVILPLVALISFLIMEKLNEIKARIQNLVNSSNEKDNRINGLAEELTIARNRIAELEAIVAQTSAEQSSLEEVSSFLSEKGY